MQDKVWADHAFSNPQCQCAMCTLHNSMSIPAGHTGLSATTGMVGTHTRTHTHTHTHTHTSRVVVLIVIPYSLVYFYVSDLPGTGAMARLRDDETELILSKRLRLGDRVIVQIKKTS